MEPEQIARAYEMAVDIVMKKRLTLTCGVPAWVKLCRITDYLNAQASAELAEVLA